MKRAAVEPEGCAKNALVERQAGQREKSWRMQFECHSRSKYDKLSSVLS